MAADRIDDNVGKKIVEALKMQDGNNEERDFSSDFEQEPVQNGGEIYNPAPEQNVQQPEVQDISSNNSQIYDNSQSSFMSHSQSFVDSAFQQSLERNLGTGSNIGDVSFPTNVEVLKQLIAKLPAGVSKQTGALIIRQTMEALGISMQSVLAEARQVQADLSSNVRECQSTIVDYRKQINMLENKAQQCQKEFSQLNDIINLFVHQTK